MYRATKKANIDTFGSSGVLESLDTKTGRKAKTTAEESPAPFFATLSKDRCSWLSDDHPPRDQWDDLELWNHLAMGSPSHQFEEAFHMDFPWKLETIQLLGELDGNLGF